MYIYFLQHSRLFLLGERLFAPELLGPHSFVDKICKARNVSIEALAIAKQISTSSAEDDQDWDLFRIRKVFQQS